MTMLDLVKSDLPNGLEIVKVKERTGSNNMKILFCYGETQKEVDFPKTCSPGDERRVCQYMLCSTMVGIALDREDYAMAKEWNEKQKQFTVKPI